MSTTSAEFCDKVRALYLEHFGDDAFHELDNGEPVSLGPVLVLIEPSYLDGETGMITCYDGSFNSITGMAHRFSIGDYRVDE